MNKFEINIPEVCLVAMIGATSSGKTQFANKYFRPTEVLSSDFFRAMISDSENDQAISKEAFDLLFYAADKRLTNMKLTVIDATNIHKESRAQIIALARKQNVHAVAIVLNLPEELLQERNRQRPERNLSPKVISAHCREVKKAIRYLKRDGFRYVYVIDSLEQLENVEIIRTKLWNDRKDEHGPFDIVGDVHGCIDELRLLLNKLGYLESDNGYVHPDGRKAAFIGDFCDRGPGNVEVLKLVMDMVRNNNAIAVPGNHDVKLYKYLNGRQIQISHGIDKTIAEIEKQDDDFKKEVSSFLDGLVSHYVLDDGKLVISHAGIKQEYIGRASIKVREFCLYGETTGEFDTYGLPVRLDWAADYRGRATIVYGHVAANEVKNVNGTYCIDTGCVFGGKLTAFRYPEREIVDVEALKQYYEPVKPLNNIKEEDGDVLRLEDYNRKMHITTELLPAIDIQENNAAAALEIMSRFAADPHWLIYLPPTMSPCETSLEDNYLEYPLQAFEYYRKRGIRNVVCEKKHMGSRAVVILCKDVNTAEKRFGINDKTRGIIYTRTGRKFFDDNHVETELLNRLDAVLNKTGFWNDFNTDWVCLDCELMPWSEKAQGLLQSQYAPTGYSGIDGLGHTIEALEETCMRPINAFDVSEQTTGQNVDLQTVLTKYRSRKEDVEKYIDAYREYCWTVKSIDDFRIAPFHILAAEGQVFADQKHIWHMETIRKYMTDIDPVFMATPYICVDTEDENSINEGIKWWLQLTGSGGEGMVVKPETYIAKENGRLIQPAIKCRGKEYLRIIYGAEYLEPEHLERLKKRSLSRKRSLAEREFSLGLESLYRFVRNEPLYRVHECAFAVLALESEPVDPRL